MSSSHVLAELRQQFADTQLPRRQARQMPGAVYTSSQVAALEKDRIFTATWLCVGREEEIGKPGDYLTGEVTGMPIIVARDKEGGVAAFLNMCLHRGVPVAEGRGNARDFSCPYHAWLYDLQGRLIVAPQMEQSDADLKNCRLKPLQLALWRGWIFISFNPDVMPFAEFIAPSEDELWWFRSGDLRLAEKAVLEIDCNWKLLVENLIDIYHVPVLHRASFGGFLKSDKSKIDFKLLPRGGWVYEQKSAPHSKGGRQLFPTLPWLEGMDVSTSMKAGIFPNINLSLRYDSLRLWSAWPVSEGKMQLHLYSLFAPSAFDRPEFPENYAEYKSFLTSAILNEDGPMVVELQKAMASGLYQPGPFSHLEGAVHHLTGYYLDVLMDEHSHG